MKILVVRQPWAWLLCHGKNVENRSWSTRYRGPLLIQASARPDPDAAAIRADVRERFGIRIPDDLEHGGIVGIATLVDCVRAHSSAWFEPGNYGWVLREARPVPFLRSSGRLGLFDPSDEIRSHVARYGFGASGSVASRPLPGGTRPCHSVTSDARLG